MSLEITSNVSMEEKKETFFTATEEKDITIITDCKQTETKKSKPKR